MEKNNDALHTSLKQLVANSKDSFVQQLFSKVVTPHTQKLALPSVGSKFRVGCEGEKSGELDMFQHNSIKFHLTITPQLQLTSLMDKLKNTVNKNFSHISMHLYIHV